MPVAFLTWFTDFVTNKSTLSHSLIHQVAANKIASKSVKPFQGLVRTTNRQTHKVVKLLCWCICLDDPIYIQMHVVKRWLFQY